MAHRYLKNRKVIISFLTIKIFGWKNENAINTESEHHHVKIRYNKSIPWILYNGTKNKYLYYVNIIIILRKC